MERKNSDWLPDEDIDYWYVYRKEFESGLDDLLGAERFLFRHGDIYHVIGELLTSFHDIRHNRRYTFKEDSLGWQSFLIHPYCYSVWGRLMSNIDKYRLVYMMTMDPENADIITYSCWPGKKEDYYHVYRWRGEIPNKHGELRRYRRVEINSRGHHYIPPCWPTIESTQQVVRGERQTAYIKRPAHEQSNRPTRND